jgi:hypothetical protein
MCNLDDDTNAFYWKLKRSCEVKYLVS